jgi:hypothetical protein
MLSYPFGGPNNLSGCQIKKVKKIAIIIIRHLIVLDLVSLTVLDVE